MKLYEFKATLGITFTVLKIYKKLNITLFYEMENDKPFNKIAYFPCTM